MDHLQTRLEALEHHVQTLQQQTHTVTRRLRWWRGLAGGLAGLAILAWMLPAVTAQEDASDKGQRGLAQRVAALEVLLKHFSREGHEVFITGANLHLVNGLGQTACGSEEEPIPDCPNGLGNLIVGYNELRDEFNCGLDPFCINVRTGSHNVVVGPRHNFSRFAGLVVGDLSTISGNGAVVIGGRGNTASGEGAVVSGGSGNTASGDGSSVSGGQGNIASTNFASVSGGSGNTASGAFAAVSGATFNTSSLDFTSVSGGVGNTASAHGASVSGGQNNTASGALTSVSGGVDNTASGDFAVVSGGSGNTASGGGATVSGGGRMLFTGEGVGNTASGIGASVSGGQGNEAGGDFAAVSGGHNRTAEGEFDWVAGSLLEDDE